jgi:hypothetical protein
MPNRPRRQIAVLVVLSCAPGVTKAQAIREVRSRVNEACCYDLDEEDVRVRRTETFPFPRKPRAS